MEEENKYKDVLKGIIEIIKNAEHSDIGFASICTYIGDHCPELGESKDEKIRKKLIEYFKNLMFGWFPYSNEEIIAYLEKLKDFDKQLEVQYNRGHDAGYIEGRAFTKQELEKSKPTPIDADKMVHEFKNFKVISCDRIPSFMEIDAYRKGVNDVLSKILIKEEKPITIGSKKAEGKLGEMIAASKEPAESGEDKELSHKEVTKKSDKDSKLSEEDEDVIYALETILDILIDPEAGIGLDEVQGVKNETMKSWLKSLKDRVQPQPKQDWSEEDEENYRNATTIISRQKLNAYTIEMMNDCSRCIDWLKSIKERLQ